MPQILDACVRDVMGKGHDEKSAWAICKSAMEMSMKENPGQKEDEADLAPYMEKAIKTHSMETYNIPGVEVFAAGTWNGDKYTVKDLDDMVDAFRETKDKVKPFLKLGHGSDQGLLRSDELPAAGWITDLRREGNKLMADFSRVPKKIYDLIKAGAYRTVSAEIFWNINILGKTFRRMLKGVALLGSELRAVTDLNDIMALYQQEQAAYSKLYSGNDTTPSVYRLEKGQLQKSKEDTHMEETVKQLEASLSEANTKLAEYQKTSEENKAKVSELSGKVDDLSEKLNAQRAENRRMKIGTYIDGLINSKKITPAQKDALTVMLENIPEDSGEKKYKIGDKEVGSFEQVVAAFIAAAPEVSLSTNGKSEHGKMSQEQDVEVSKIQKYADEHKVSFREAMIALSVAEKARA